MFVGSKDYQITYTVICVYIKIYRYTFTGDILYYYTYIVCTTNYFTLQRFKKRFEILYFGVSIGYNTTKHKI